MASFVKSIFKWLLVPLVIVIVIISAIEILNVDLQAPQVKNNIYVGMTNSCNLFTQETYKQANDLGISDILTYKNSKYISKDFYWGLTNKEAIYNKMYCNQEFLNWLSNLNNNKGSAYWKSITLLQNGLTRKIQGLGKPTAPTTASASDWGAYNDNYISSLYIDSYYTPLNLGVTYFNQEVLTNMAKWEVACILSNSNNVNVTDTDYYGNHTSNYYVQYHGFMCYVDKLQITNIQYQVWDMAKLADRKSYYELTQVDVNNEFSSSSSNIANGIGYDWSAINTDERRYLVTTTISYSMPMSYKGITPLANLISWAAGGTTKNESSTTNKLKTSIDNITGSITYSNIR